MYVGRHRKPLSEAELICLNIAAALRHLGATPDGLMGPWDDRRTPDDAWALAGIDTGDVLLAQEVAR